MRLDAAEQANDRTYSAAQVIQQTATGDSKQVRVRAHFFWGKEGSMIYDSFFKAILPLQASDEYKRKHPRIEYLISGQRKSNLVDVTGRLKVESPGRPVFVADDLIFLPKAR